MFGHTLHWPLLLSDSRLTDSKADDPWRTAFERDYDRAVFCTPVRRLQDKAQVFPMDEHDGVRTRLTHSLEVSTVAKTLARAAAEHLERQGELKTKNPRESVSAIETI